MTSTQPILLADYRAPAYLVESVKLIFRLAPETTKVQSEIRFRPNPDAPGKFWLDGENLKLLWAKIDGQPVEADQTARGLSCDVPKTSFTWECEVEIDPKSNTALEGLYMSNGMYCTQCEAEGFRKITYYPDRPDVMAPFQVRIEGDASVLLSNGNPVRSGDGWAEWQDPWPKPAYLFALVAGDLRAVSDHFTTMSGREVALNIWVRPGDESKCAYALDALKRSMRWDEETYGREYDLDVFSIVAVDDFNMGAMENKGLNIFNSKYVLASPETATDQDYEFIESIIAHEYFHNWTGNRITCRDWFQLCLKEGLTVFRDQQFSGDARSRAVKRINDVAGLRATQFREDAGPLAHPVRPESYIEINNFYTATVYDKGAEVIGMLKRLVGDNGYRKALDLYFERHDGDAATIEDWLKVFEDATGRDLTQFKRWYSQAGTPRVKVSESFEAGKYRLTFRQQTDATPGQSDKQPQHIPIAYGLLDKSGKDLFPTRIFELTEAEQSLEFDDLDRAPVASLLREFSAPVTLDFPLSIEDRALLLGYDSDPFNKWEAARSLARGALVNKIIDNTPPPDDYLDALGSMVSDQSLEPAFRAAALRLPNEEIVAQSLAEKNHIPDPDEIYAARRALETTIAGHLQDKLESVFASLELSGPYRPDAEDAGKRELRLTSLGYLSRLDGGARALELFETADNMSDEQGALAALLAAPHAEGQKALTRFYNKWHKDRIVLDKWFALQVGLAAPEAALESAQALLEHKDFDWTNPNRLRSVLGSFVRNLAGFHMADGQGYAFLAQCLLRLDRINPQTAARLSTGFDTWRRYDVRRRNYAKQALESISKTENLSRDLKEMVDRILAG